MNKSQYNKATVIKIIRYLWWLVLYVNLTGLRDAQKAGKILFLGVSVRVFPEEIGI